MALTRDFKVTVRERLQRDPAFREALLTEAVDCLLSSDAETGKSLLRDYVNATIGVRRTRRTHRQVAEEPDAHAQFDRQSPRAQPVRDHRLSTATGRRASEGPGSPLTVAARLELNVRMLTDHDDARHGRNEQV